MTEEWKLVAGYPQHEVSSLGRVRRVTPACGTRPGRVLKGVLCQGYPQVTLGREPHRRRFSIHSLVAVAFLGPRPPGLVINHKNHDRTDNRKTNLEYITQGENVWRGELHYEARLNSEAVKVMRVLARTDKRRGLRPLLARLHGITEQAVYFAISGRNWKGVAA